jgi:hypothetical protein
MRRLWSRQRTLVPGLPTKSGGGDGKWKCRQRAIVAVVRNLSRVKYSLFELMSTKKEKKEKKEILFCKLSILFMSSF